MHLSLLRFCVQELCLRSLSLFSCPFTPALHGLSSLCTLGGLNVDCSHPLLRKARVADWEFYKLTYLRKLVISVPCSGTLLGHFTSE